MDHLATIPMEVKTFLANGSWSQNKGTEWAIESRTYIRCMIHILLCLLTTTEVNSKMLSHRVLFISTECLNCIYLLWICGRKRLFHSCYNGFGWFVLANHVHKLIKDSLQIAHYAIVNHILEVVTMRSAVASNGCNTLAIVEDTYQFFGNIFCMFLCIRIANSLEYSI